MSEPDFIRFARAAGFSIVEDDWPQGQQPDMLLFSGDGYHTEEVRDVVRLAQLEMREKAAQAVNESSPALAALIMTIPVENE